MGTRPVALVIASVLLVASPVRADREIEAQQLFEEGKALMGERRHGEACKKFEASHRLAPSAATLMNLGACQEADGRLASAWATFRQAQAQASRVDPKLVEPSRQRADTLQPRLSSLRIVVPDSSRVPGLEVMRNGLALEEAQWGSRVFVDGGEYEIVARAPGTVAWTARVAVATELDQKEVEIPRLTEAVVGGAPAPDATATEVAPSPGPADARSGAFTRTRKVALGVAAGGAVALTGGIVLGLRARGYQADSDAICPTTTCNDPEGLRLNREARSTGTQATIGFVAGGALVAAGVTLWLLGGPEPGEGSRVGVAPLVGGGAIGLTFSGDL